MVYPGNPVPQDPLSTEGSELCPSLGGIRRYCLPTNGPVVGPGPGDCSRDPPGGNRYTQRFYGYAPRRLVLHLASPSDILLSARGAGWLRDLFVHELAHFFHLTTPVGWIGGLSRVFGQSVMLGPRATMPTWASEGVAVYLETQFSQGGRGRNPWLPFPSRP
jgi:hypothetical protein